jgi:hypothetical protein
MTGPFAFERTLLQFPRYVIRPEVSPNRTHGLAPTYVRVVLRQLDVSGNDRRERLTE